MANDSLITGFFLGIVFVLALAPFFFWFGAWKKGVTAFFKPQAVVQKTKKSPFQVLSQTLKQIFWAMLLFLAVALIFLYFIR